jgi:hypothetical protein
MEYALKRRRYSEYPTHLPFKPYLQIASRGTGQMSSLSLQAIGSRSHSKSLPGRSALRTSLNGGDVSMPLGSLRTRKIALLSLCCAAVKWRGPKVVLSLGADDQAEADSSTTR